MSLTIRARAKQFSEANGASFGGGGLALLRS
jgi:hypothetical protein